MCGIAGFVGSGSRDVLAKMTSRLAHRGPDGEGLWVDEAHRVFLGHRILAIVDLANGQQPMLTADSQLAITFNGEIYNHRDLRQELEAAGHQFHTDHSDTEVLLYAYRQWGPKMLPRLNGMWAFAIYDAANQSVFLSRDRFGKKPLFYHFDGKTLVFASELTSLILHPEVPRSFDQESLKKLFAYGFIPAPRALLENVRKLPAGHWMKFDLGKRQIEIQEYWRFEFDPFPKIPKDPEQEWGSELIRLLDTAVKRRLDADVPVGVFLSGGIDSSLVATLATRHQAVVETFSIGFAEKSFDEREYAQLMAKRLGTRHFEEVFSIQHCLDFAPSVAQNLDEVFGDSSILPTTLVSKLARTRVKVVLGGDGSDELFAGYDPFQALRFAIPYNRFTPKAGHAAIQALANRLPVSHVNMSLDFKVKRMLRGLSYSREYWLPTWMGPLHPAEIADLFGAPVDPQELYSEAVEAWNEPTARTDVDRAMQFYLRLYLPDDILVKVDRASMAYGLEARAPFLDIDLVNFVRRIPSEYKLRGRTTKYLLKEAARSLLPAEIIDRRKKGFGVPIGQWFQSGALSLNGAPAKPGSGSATHGAAGLDRNVVKERLRQHTLGQHDDRAALWCIWMLDRSPLR
ncbi:MAG TPA: asparagine synthase (glutamine-hydrolyzing) [Chthoniobacterales bacterium]|nr:asparagine synthase (glutamine-hydrolyzing) [Chthoniobacterales bacterium]